MSALCPYELEDDVWDEFEENDDHIVPRPSREYRNQISVWNDSWKKSKREAIDSTTDLDIANECGSFGKHKLNMQSFFGKGSVSENGSWSEEVKTMTSSRTSMANHCLRSSGTDAGDGESCTGDSIIVGSNSPLEWDLYHYRVKLNSQADSDHSFLENNQRDKNRNELLYYGWQDIGNFDDVDSMFRSSDLTFGSGNLSNDEEYCWYGSSHASELSFDFTCSEGILLEGLAPNNEDFKQMNACGFNRKSNVMEEKMDAEEHNSLGRIVVANQLKPKSALEDESMSGNQVFSFGSGKLTVVESPHNPSSDGPGKCFDVNNKTKLHYNVPAAVTKNFEQTTSSVAFNKRVSCVEQVLSSEREMEDHSEFEEIEMGMAGEIDSMNFEESDSMSSLLNEISPEATSFQQLQRVIEQMDLRTKLCIRDGLYRMAKSAEERHNCIDPKDKTGDSKEASEILIVQDMKRCSAFPDMEMDTNPIDRSIAELLFHRPSDSSVQSF